MRFAIYGTKSICRLCRVTPRTLRHYHKIGLLPETSRTTSGYREYTFEDLRDVLRARRLVELGFSLEEVKEILRGSEAQRLSEETIHRKKAEVSAQVTNLQKRLRALEEVAAADGYLHLPANLIQRLDHIREAGGLTEEDLAPLIHVVELVVACDRSGWLDELVAVLDHVAEALDQFGDDFRLDRELRRLGPEASEREIQALADAIGSRIVRRVTVPRPKLDNMMTELVESSLWGLFNDQQLAVLDRALATKNES
ncbi:MAG: MerR family transcriptional regulator [Propionibacteriaceae bacterium]|nr:MerR family transcriptional regulator [Propionibacteriaceae bacterium]